jgi:hypothetical protein
MKKYMVADLIKSTKEKELGQLPLETPDEYIYYWENVLQYPGQGYYDFQVRASKGKGKGNMHDNPMRVYADPIYESIGLMGNDTPMYDVYCEWHGPTGAKSKAYEMTIDEIDSWSNDTSGTYFNLNVREAGPYLPYPPSF